MFLFFSEGGFLSVRDEITGTHTQGGAFSPVLGSRVISYADDDTATERNIYDIPDYSEPTSSPAPQVGDTFNFYLIQSSAKKQYILQENILLIIDSGRWIGNNSINTR